MTPSPHRFALIAPLLGAVIGLFAPTTGLGAAEPTQPNGAEAPPASSFQDIVHSYLVDVEVWVDDGRGRPITGLTADDFEVSEDGQPVEVTHFAEARGSQPVTNQLTPGRGETGRPPATDSAQEQGGYLVLYFDLLHLSPDGSRQMVRDLREFLASERLPSSQIMVLAQSNKLSTVVPLGASGDDIDRALEALAEADTLGAPADREKRLTLKRLQQSWDFLKTLPGAFPCRRFVPQAMAEIRDFAAERSTQITLTLDFLADVTGYLSALPGLKTLVYLGDQLETTPGRGLVTFVDTVCPPSRRPDPFLNLPDDLVDQFNQLTSHANTNQVTFYAFQTGGLKPGFLTSAEMASSDLLNRGGLIEASLRTNGRGGLSYLAAQTGGLSMFNTNRFDKELAIVARELTGYYSLAYVPPHGGDGQIHRIEVKVRDGVPRSPGGATAKRVEVRHRRGYRDKGDDVRMAERIEGAAHLGLVSNPLEVRLGAGALEPVEGGRYRLPLHVVLPAANATFLPAGDSAAARLELVATAYDSQDQVVSSTRSTFQVDRPAPGEPPTLDLVTQVDIGPGRYLVVVGLRDETTRQASYVSTAVEVTGQ